MEKIPLSDGKPGCKYIILEIADEKRLQNRVSSMGLMPGGKLEVCQNLKKQPVLIFARDTLIAIGRDESGKIMIGPEGYENEKIMNSSADYKSGKIALGPDECENGEGGTDHE